LVKTLAATGVLHMSTAALEEIVQRILKSWWVCVVVH
jgi:hypothetical protein